MRSRSTLLFILSFCKLQPQRLCQSSIAMNLGNSWILFSEIWPKNWIHFFQTYSKKFEGSKFSELSTKKNWTWDFLLLGLSPGVHRQQNWLLFFAYFQLVYWVLPIAHYWNIIFRISCPNQIVLIKKKFSQVSYGEFGDMYEYRNKS